MSVLGRALYRNLRNVYGVGSPTVGTTSSSVRLHIYMTEISLIVTLNNQFTHSLRIIEFGELTFSNA